MTYSVAGSYFETCNCDAICPCRMVDGVKGGRSTHGICFGALAWLVEAGHVGDVDVSGLAAVLVVRYDDDEPGSPWTIVLHVDAAGNDEQRAALADVFLGSLGGAQGRRTAVGAKGAASAGGAYGCDRARARR